MPIESSRGRSPAYFADATHAPAATLLRLPGALAERGRGPHRGRREAPASGFFVWRARPQTSREAGARLPNEAVAEPRDGGDARAAGETGAMAAMFAVALPAIPTLSEPPRGFARRVDRGRRPGCRRSARIANRAPTPDDRRRRRQGRVEERRGPCSRTGRPRPRHRAECVRGPGPHLRQARAAGRLEPGALPRALLPGVSQVPRSRAALPLRGRRADAPRGARARSRLGLRVDRARTCSPRPRSRRSTPPGCTTASTSSSRCSARTSRTSSRPTCACSAGALAP